MPDISYVFMTPDVLVESHLPVSFQLFSCVLTKVNDEHTQDLFFEFPWNNFLHSAVYDLVHQILTGNVESGVNRELAIALFHDARLMHRIVDGQKRSDAKVCVLSFISPNTRRSNAYRRSKPNGVRLGYMGHLTLISEDVLTTLGRFPPEL